MVQRVLYGTLVLAVLYFIFWLDVAIAHRCEDMPGALGELLRRGSVLPLLVVALFLRGGVELDRMLRAKGANPHTYFSFLLIVLFIFTPWFCASGLLGTGTNSKEVFYWMIAWMVIAVMGTGVLTVFRQNPVGTINDVGATLITIFYLGFMGSFAILLRCGQNLPTEKGAWLLFVVAMVIKASDIGAYFVGSTLGRHKLIPKISPGKTIEGMFGGLAASALLAMFFASISSLFHLTEFNVHAGRLAELAVQESLPAENGLSPMIRACIFGIIVSFVGQIGDLFESCFKRDAGNKDSGKVIPRFGGILDLVDSPVLAVPIAWFLLVVVWGIV